MKLEMLVSLAGADFSLAPGDETERFKGAEAERLIEAGYAKKAPAKEPRKPATKAEWDDERVRMLAELADLRGELDAGRQREILLSQQLAELLAAMGDSTPAPDVAETAVQPPPPETRG